MEVEVVEVLAATSAVFTVPLGGALTAAAAAAAKGVGFATELVVDVAVVIDEVIACEVVLVDGEAPVEVEAIFIKQINDFC